MERAREGMSAVRKEKDQPHEKNKNTENFPVGSFLIREALRKHVHAFYNFARASDDIADHPLMEPAEKLKQLNRFEAVLLGQGDDVREAAAMRASLAETAISPQHCVDLLRAFKQDAVKRRYVNWQELMEYCRYSASPVGRYVLALHGVGENAWLANDTLCSALQVINHLQDCADDYRELDRVYLPLEDMAACGATLADLSKPAISPALRKALDMQLERMAPMLKTARDLPRNVPDIRLKMETSIICVLAENLVQLLRRRDPLSQNAKLSKPAMFLSAFYGLVRAPF